jgi:hypothetical protein
MFVGSDKFNCKTDGKSYFVEGHIATGDLDLGNDIIVPEGLDDIFRQTEERAIKLDFEHETLLGKTDLEKKTNLTKMPLGKRVESTRDEKGVSLSFQLNPSWKKFDGKGNVTYSFKDVWSAIEGGYYDGFSIGYIPTETKPFLLPNGQEGRKLLKTQLLTVALTGTPMNPAADLRKAFAKSMEFLNGDKMEKENEKDKKEEVKEEIKEMPPEPKPEKPKPEEVVDVALVEIKSKVEALEKSDTEKEALVAEMKSLNAELKAQLDALKVENAELKTFVEAARMKAVQQDRSEFKETDERRNVGDILSTLR